MIINSIRNYIRQFKCLDTFNDAIKVNANYVEDGSDTYLIKEIQCKSILKKYVDGTSEKQYQFVFTSKKPYGNDVLTNIDNSGFYEKFAKEIEENNNKGLLPVLKGNLVPLELEILTSGHAVEATEDTAKFQIELRLKYMEGSR